MTISELIRENRKFREEGGPLGPTSEYYRFVPKDVKDNIAFRKELLTVAHDPEIRQELIFACSRDILFYINAFGWTLSPKDYADCPTRLFLTYPFQDRAILQLCEAIGYHDIAVPKSRDMGATWICLVAMEWLWHFRPQRFFLLTSQTEELVESKSEKALFKKLDFWWKHQPNWLMPNRKRTIKACENVRLHSKFTGQATVPNIARGDRLTALFKDEAAEMANAGEIASATRDATNCRIDNSTPNGRFGTGQYFYTICKNPAVRKIWIHWSEHPEKSRGLYKLMRRVTDSGKTELPIGSWISETEIDRLRNARQMIQVGELQKCPLPQDTYDWRADYDFERLRFREGQNPRSAWYDLQLTRDPNPKRIAKELNLDFEGSTEKLSSGVDMETLRSTMCRKPLYHGEVMPSEESHNRGLQFMRPVWLAGTGFLEIWCDLPEGRPPASSYSIGVDISSGTGGDKSSQSVMSIWDNVSGEQVGEWRSSIVSPDDLGIKAVVLAKWFHDAMLIPEINGGGGQRFKNKVIACEYFNMYRRSRSEVEAYESPTSKLGWYSSKGPEVLLRGLFAAFSSGEAKPRSSTLLEQCEEYEWNNGKVIHKASVNSDSHSGKGAAHGDCAVAAGLGWLGVETAKQLTVDGKPKLAPEDPDAYPEGSIGWRRKQRDVERQRSSGDLIESVW